MSLRDNNFDSLAESNQDSSYLGHLEHGRRPDSNDERLRNLDPQYEPRPLQLKEANQSTASYGANNFVNQTHQYHSSHNFESQPEHTASMAFTNMTDFRPWNSYTLVDSQLTRGRLQQCSVADQCQNFPGSCIGNQPSASCYSNPNDQRPSGFFAEVVPISCAEFGKAFSRNCDLA